MIPGSAAAFADGGDVYDTALLRDAMVSHRPLFLLGGSAAFEVVAEEFVTATMELIEAKG